jgi:hypothetical protein
MPRTPMLMVYSLASLSLFFMAMRLVHIESGWQGYWLAATLTIVVTLVAIVDLSEHDARED